LAKDVKNSFINLALPLFVFSEPTEVGKKKDKVEFMKMTSAIEDKLKAHADHFTYAGLMNDFCNTYSENKIIWAHLGGLSLELMTMDVREHAKFLHGFFV